MVGCQFYVLMKCISVHGYYCRLPDMFTHSLGTITERPGKGEVKSASHAS